MLLKQQWSLIDNILNRDFPNYRKDRLQLQNFWKFVQNVGSEVENLDHEFETMYTSQFTERGLDHLILDIDNLVAKVIYFFPLFFKSSVTFSVGCATSGAGIP